jgi:hypothetical protein
LPISKSFIFFFLKNLLPKLNDFTNTLSWDTFQQNLITTNIFTLLFLLPLLNLSQVCKVLLVRFLIWHDNLRAILSVEKRTMFGFYHQTATCNYPVGGLLHWTNFLHSSIGFLTTRRDG